MFFLVLLVFFFVMLVFFFVMLVFLACGRQAQAFSVRSNECRINFPTVSAASTQTADLKNAAPSRPTFMRVVLMRAILMLLVHVSSVALWSGEA